MSTPLTLTYLTRRPHVRRSSIDPGLVLAAAASLALVFVALFGARIAPHESIFFVIQHGADQRPYDPGTVFPFGSDVLGRDIFSLVLAGAGTTLTIALAGGAARVAAGMLLAAAGSWWRPVHLVTESLSDLVSAIPATLVALVVVKILVRADTTVLVFVGALLLIGWVGPYRVVRAEIDRLQHAPFVVGARALGVGRRRLFWRHQVPHLVPTLAINLAQQTVASLVLVAELGVLGTFVGTTRAISIEESLTRVITGPVNAATIADPPEWGGLLASARTIEALWTTRWLIAIPGLAFAATAIAVATIGYAIARRYARHDIVSDLRSRAMFAFVALLAALVLASTLIPVRYAEARAWADGARAQLATAPDEPARDFARAGLVPVGGSYAVTREAVRVVRSAPATVTIGGVTLDEESTREKNAPLNSRHVEAYVSADTGGGSVTAPLVYASRGISPSSMTVPPPHTTFAFVLPDVGVLVKDYPDDWQGIDVRGKIAVLVRFVGVATRPPSSRSIANVPGIPAEDSIADAIRRGAAGVIFVDPALTLYTDAPTTNFTFAANGITGGMNPYLQAEQETPPKATGGIPVVVVSPSAAARLLGPIGLNVSAYTRLDQRNEYAGTRSTSRDLGVMGTLNVPLEARHATTTSYIGEVPSAPSDPHRILIWADDAHGSRPVTPILTALARTVGTRPAPFIFVAFDSAVDARANAALVRERLKDRTIDLVIVLGRLDGSTLRFITPFGDLIPAFDLYADRADAPHRPTTATAALYEMGDQMPFVDLRTIVVTSTGADGDAREAAAAVLGYVAGRWSLGAEELQPR